MHAAYAAHAQTHARTRAYNNDTHILIPPPPSARRRVKNKQPAPVQITAEQILREAKERQVCVCVCVCVNEFVCVYVYVYVREFMCSSECICEIYT